MEQKRFPIIFQEFQKRLKVFANISQRVTTENFLPKISEDFPINFQKFPEDFQGRSKGTFKF